MIGFNINNKAVKRSLGGFFLVPSMRENKPPVQPEGKIKELCKRKTFKYNGKCLTTHYRRIQGGF